MGVEPGERTAWTWLRLVELVEGLVVGVRPVDPRQGPRPPRADRAAFFTVAVHSGRLTWRSRWGRSKALAIAEVARVALIEVVYVNTKGPDSIVLYAVVIGHDGAVRLRIGAQGIPRGRIARKRRLREMWEPLGVPARLEGDYLSRAKDYRRRWPEAFAFAHAYPFVTTALAFAGWMLLVVPVLDRLLGP
ncbi:hypothetical protein [Actinotalea sp. K2]|uniref:hypothetical protein n=1 Tax=Actinotalea sp. K2 TaxID=2939438 RepID=UPI00201710C5|nr:hypothetical protein [Actinotalea sp. K2]MCL3859638.1 hypothetical protein [Actinotalea sp. K2]